MAPESNSMRVCLTRWIVGIFYPDNEMLASSLVPRWNFLSWILSQCAVSHSMSVYCEFYVFVL